MSVSHHCKWISLRLTLSLIQCLTIRVAINTFYVKQSTGGTNYIKQSAAGTNYIQQAIRGSEAQKYTNTNWSQHQVHSDGLRCAFWAAAARCSRSVAAQVRLPVSPGPFFFCFRRCNGPVPPLPASQIPACPCLAVLIGVDLKVDVPSYGCLSLPLPPLPTISASTAGVRTGQRTWHATNPVKSVLDRNRGILFALRVDSWWWGGLQRRESPTAHLDLWSWAGLRVRGR
jgi:hypothetical protein